jgi:hypothetical protein
MQEWIHMKPEQKKAAPLTEEISLSVDRFFFNHYCHNFRSGAFARANSSMYALLNLLQNRNQPELLSLQTNDEHGR